MPTHLVPSNYPFSWFDLIWVVNATFSNISAISWRPVLVIPLCYLLAATFCTLWLPFWYFLITSLVPSVYLIGTFWLPFATIWLPFTTVWLPFWHLLVILLVPSTDAFNTFFPFSAWCLLITDMVHSDYPFVTDNPLVSSDNPLVPTDDLFGTFWLPPVVPYGYPFDTFW